MIMNVLKRVFVLGIICGFTTLSVAQENRPKPERPERPAATDPATQAKRDSLKASKVAELRKFREDLFVERLKLTADEKAKFFAVYDEYQLKLKEAKMAFRKKWAGKKPEDLTDAEAQQYFQEAITLRKQEVDLLQNYGKRLEPIIGMNRVIQLPQIEREIKKELITKARSMRKKKGQGGSSGGNRPNPDSK
jgi:hypothetical protein